MSSLGERPRCAACAHSKRKCSPECVYAPHFPADDAARYAAVHKAFPVRNVGQLLRELPPDQRGRTADLLIDMARARPDERLADNLQELRALLNPAPEPEAEAAGRPRCAACRKLHGSCTPDCIFAPFFPPDDDSSERFAAVHDVFGYKNAAAVLGGVSPDMRRAAADALVYSAIARRRDPVRGCVGEISSLTASLKQVYEQLAASKAVLAGYEDAAGAHAGTSSAVETQQYDAMVREMAMHLAAFVEVATDDVRAEPGSSSGVTVAISAPRPSDEAGPSLVQEKQPPPPPPPQEQAATATVGDPSPPPFARAAAPRPVVVDWHQLAAALEATRLQTMAHRQAAAGAHARLAHGQQLRRDGGVRAAAPAPRGGVPGPAGGAADGAGAAAGRLRGGGKGGGHDDDDDDGAGRSRRACCARAQLRRDGGSPATRGRAVRHPAAATVAGANGDSGRRRP